MVAAIIQWIEENSQGIECLFYEELAVRAYGAAVTSALTGQFWLAGGMAAAGSAALYTSSLAGCLGGDPPEPPANPSAGECWKTSEPSIFQYSTNGGFTNVGTFERAQILSQEVYIRPDGFTGSKGQILNFDGQTQNYVVKHSDPNDTRVRLFGAECGEVAPPLEPPPPHTPGEPIAPPQYHTTPDGCNWTIQATDAYIDNSGIWHTYYEITADDPACGGPFAYWSSGGGKEPKFVQPSPPDPDGNPQPPVPPENYKPDFENIEDKIDEIKEELDAVKDCACGDPKPELLGDWVSIRFVSDGNSPNGTAPLRKLFRYRSQSSRDEQQLRDYWAGFTWQAGPVIVQHKGTWWGTPQVWASSAEEGKRVLRFAAGEAGASPDTDGEWIVTGSASPRYGMQGTMRVQQYRGRDWITSRIGPSGPVEL